MTNSPTSNEREERLTKPYKEYLRETLKTVEDYRGYLNACHEEGPETFTLAVQDVLDFTATAMRDKCVEKIKAALADVRRNWPNGTPQSDYALGLSSAFSYALAAIQSLTLDQVEQEKR